jgi:hypothetical protein
MLAGRVTPRTRTSKDVCDRVGTQWVPGGMSTQSQDANMLTTQRRILLVLSGPCPPFQELGHTNRHKPGPLAPETPSGSLDQYCNEHSDHVMHLKQAVLVKLAFGPCLFRSESSEINSSQLCPSTFLELENVRNHSCGIRRDQAKP